MNKLYYVFCLLIVGLIAVSCDNSDLTSTDNDNSRSDKTENKDTLKKKEAIALTSDAILILKEDVNKLKKNDTLTNININSLTNSQDALKNTVEELEKDKMGLSQLLLYLLLFTFVILVVLILVLRKQFMSEDKVKSYVNNKLKAYVQMSQAEASFTHYSNQISNNRIKIQDLDDRFSRLERKVSSQSGSTIPRKDDSPSSLPKGEQRSKNEPKAQPGEFYMLPALQDGEFDVSCKKTIKSEDTYYTFTLDKHNANKATFKFDPYDESRVMYALNYREEILGKVCEIEGNCDSGNARFTQEEGVAEQKDGNWIVKKRAVVKFM